MSGLFAVDDLADAIVALYASGVTPPSGQSNLTTVTADVPDAIVQERTLIVFPPEPAPISFGPSVRKTVARFPIRFFLWNVRDNARNTRLLRKWASVLYWQIDRSAHLGHPEFVTWAEVDDLPFVGKLIFNGVEYYGAEFHVAAHLWEGIAAVA